MSVKEPLFRKSSGTQIVPTKIIKNEYQCNKRPPQASRKCSSVVSQETSFDLKINELTNEESIRQEILGINAMNYENDDLNNEQDLSDYNDYLRDLEKEEYAEKEPILNKTMEVQNVAMEEISGSITDLNKPKLDTINESITEVVQLNIKKLQLNKKEELTAAPQAQIKPLTLAEKIKNVKSKTNTNKRFTPPIAQPTPLKSQSKSKLGINMSVNNSSPKTVKTTKPTVPESSRSVRPTIQSGSSNKYTKPSTAPDSAKSIRPSITIETEKALKPSEANDYSKSSVKNEPAKAEKSSSTLESQKKISVVNTNNLAVNKHNH